MMEVAHGEHQSVGRIEWRRIPREGVRVEVELIRVALWINGGG